MKKLLLIIANILIIPPVAMYSYYTFSPAKQALDNPATITTASTPKVLGATDEQDQIYFTVNIPATFKQDISAPNVVYSVNGESGEISIDNSLIAGDGIEVDGRTISNTGILTLVAGTGITVDGSTITNSGITSLSAGTGISVDGSTITNTYSFTPDYTQSGWTDSGSSVTLTTTTDTVTMDTITFGNATITNGKAFTPNTDLGSDLGSSALRFNNLWVANINSNSSQSFSGQTTFSYPPTDTTIDEASVLINPTTSAASGQLLGLAIAGYQKALIDEDGDIILGYSDATSAPASDYPLNVYGHSGTRVAFVDTSGRINVNGGSESFPSLQVDDTNTGIYSNGSGSIFFTHDGTWRWQLSANGLESRWGGVVKYGGPSLTSPVFTRNTDTNTGLGLGDSDTLSLITGGANRLHVDASGNVGIGTTSPPSKLSIYSNTDNSGQTARSYVGGLRVANGSNAIGSFSLITLPTYGSDGQNIGSEDGSFIKSILNGNNDIDLALGSYSSGGTITEGLRIDNNGLVGIGTTVPIGLLNVQGGAKGKALAIFNETGNQDIIAASASGIPKFRVANNGYTYGERFVDMSNSGYYLDPAASDTSLLVAGSVGIGTTGPQGKLHISAGTSGTGILIDGFTAATNPTIANTGNNEVTFRGSGGNTANGIAYNFVRYDSAASFLAITQAGNVGIGTASPTYKFEVEAGTSQIRLSGGASGTRFQPRLVGNRTVSGMTEIGNLILYSAGSGSSGETLGVGSIDWYEDGGGASRDTKLMINVRDGGTERSLILDGSVANGQMSWPGNVGIGTTAPSQALQVEGQGFFANSSASYDPGGGAGPGVRIGYNTTSDYGYVFANDTGVTVKHLYLGASPSVGIFLENTGNVGIGTTSPAVNLHVKNGAANSNVWLATENDARQWLVGVRGDESDKFQIIDNTAGTAVRLAINTSGSVGIGTAVPSKKLSVVAGSDTWASGFFGLSSSNQVVIGTYGSVATIGANNNQGSAWANLSINPGGGGVGIGTTAPANTLDVNGFIRSGVGAYTHMILEDDESTNGIKYIHANSNVVGFLNGSGSWMSYLTNAGSWVALSDENLKKNIVPLTGVLDKLDQINGVYFDWKDPIRGTDKQIGVIAQEIEKVFPELVDTDFQGNKSVAYDRLAPILIQAIKEQQLEIDGLSSATQSAQVAIIESEISTLDSLISEIREMVNNLAEKVNQFAEEFTTKKSHQETLCIGESTDDETCLNKDQVDQLIQLLPSLTPTPEPSSTPEPSTTPSPSPDPSSTPEPSPEASDSGSVTP